MLVVNKWLSVQAVSNLPGAIARMDSLIGAHIRPAFTFFAAAAEASPVSALC